MLIKYVYPYKAVYNYMYIQIDHIIILKGSDSNGTVYQSICHM